MKNADENIAGTVEYFDIDGRPSALINCNDLSYYSNILLIDYSSSDVIEFNFRLSAENRDQTIQDIIDSIKVK